MCTGLEALFAVPSTTAATTTAATTAGAIASGAAVPTAVGAGVTGTATSTGLATGAALAPAAVTPAATGGLGATLAKGALALAPGLATPLLLRPKLPKLQPPAISDPVNSAAKARMAARLKAQGAYGKSATVLTGGSGAAPTSGQKLKLGA